MKMLKMVLGKSSSSSSSSIGTPIGVYLESSIAVYRITNIPSYRLCAFYDPNTDRTVYIFEG